MAVGRAAQALEVDVPGLDARLGHGGEHHLARVEGHVGHREARPALKRASSRQLPLLGSICAPTSTEREASSWPVASNETQPTLRGALRAPPSAARPSSARGAPRRLRRRWPSSRPSGDQGNPALPAAGDLVAGQGFAAGGVPDHHHAVAAGRSEPRAVGRKAQRKHPLAVPVELEPPCCRKPGPRRRSCGGWRPRPKKRCPVRTKPSAPSSRGARATPATGHGAGENAHRAIVRAGSHLQAVRRKGNRPNHLLGPLGAAPAAPPLLTSQSPMTPSGSPEANVSAIRRPGDLVDVTGLNLQRRPQGESPPVAPPSGPSFDLGASRRPLRPGSFNQSLTAAGDLVGGGTGSGPGFP